MQTLIDTGAWQAMTPAEQERVLAQAKRNISLEDIGKMATRANVKQWCCHTGLREQTAALRGWRR